MSQNEKATQFADLHKKGAPILLYNAWDAGSAKTIAKAGASAIATSSWAVAVAQGYSDGEGIPLDLFIRIASRVVDSVDVPVSIDFEGGFAADDDAKLAENFTQLIETGAVGINFEDRVVSGDGLYSKDRQAQRIRTIRSVADKKGVAFFINARTDLFLGRPFDPVDGVKDAIERAKAYADAGASGFFIPGLADEALIAQIVEGSPIPVNVMVMGSTPPIERLVAIGVARISYGNIPYVDATNLVAAEAEKALSGAVRVPA